jgi:hypothetical protein
MMYRSLLGPIALTAALTMTSGARAHDETRYPDWKGQWVRAGSAAAWDPTRPPGLPQQAPLTPEYQARFEAALAKRATGSLDSNPTTSCLPAGMPRAMVVYEPMEIVITQDVTFVMISFMNELRRIYTDGRKWPEEIEPSFEGYSIGKWEDTDGDGRFDTLVIETRSLKGPRFFDSTGVPLHDDNQSVIVERISLDKSHPDVLRNEITVSDHALTRPWTVTRPYKRERSPTWIEYVCAEDNHQVVVGKENYFISADGLLMPTRKEQPAPDLKYFNQAHK